MLDKEQKQKVLKQFGIDEKNTGSLKAQVALLSADIEEVHEHLKRHPKDDHSRRGLLKKVIKRKKLLKELKSKDPETYKKVVKKAGLKE